MLVQILFISLFVFSEANANIINENCDYLNIKGKNFEKKILKSNVIHPSELNIDYAKEYLFYSYTEEDGLTSISKTAYLNLKTLEVTEIAGTESIITSAIDKKNQKIYLGGQNGIYEYHFKTNKALDIGISKDNIWQMVYKDGLYYTTYKPDEQAFLYKDGVVQKITGPYNPRIRVLGIDKENNIYFANTTGLFYMEKATTRTSMIVEDIVINAFNNDVNDELYFSTPSSLHIVKTNSKIVEKIADFPDASLWGFAIDGSGNIIYGSDESIIKLIPTTNKCE